MRGLYATEGSQDEATKSAAPGRRPSGRDAKRAARTARAAASIPYITRQLPYYEVLNQAGLELLERNADTILAEVGIEFREDPEVLQIWRTAGADVQGERFTFPRNMCRELVQRTAPREFTQYARNPERNVVIGGNRTVFAPAYGSPFVRSLDEGRRYARIEFSRLRQTHLHGHVVAPLGWNDLRTGGPAGQQTASGYGLQPYEIQ